MRVLVFLLVALILQQQELAQLVLTTPMLMLMVVRIVQLLR